MRKVVSGINQKLNASNSSLILTTAVGGNKHLIWDTANETLDIQSINTFSGTLRVQQGTVKINAVGNIGKAANANASISAFSNIVGVGTKRVDSSFAFAQRFQIDGSVYPDGVLMTHLGRWVFGEVETENWITLTEEDGTVLANVTTPQRTAASQPTGTYYVELPTPIHLEPNRDYKLNTKRGTASCSFYNNYTGTTAVGVKMDLGGAFYQVTMMAADYFPPVTGNNQAAGILWAGLTFKFNPIPYKVIVSGGVLDLTALPVSDTYKIMEQTKLESGTIKRKWLPNDNPKVVSWQDWSDKDTMFYRTIGGVPEVRIVRDKIRTLNAQWYNNNASHIYNMVYRNGRLEGDNRNNSNGNILRSLRTSVGASAGYFWVGQRMAGATNRRIFDAVTGNYIMGFHANGDRGVAMGSPNDYVIGFAVDNDIQIFSADRNSNGFFDQRNNNPAGTHILQKWNTSTAANIQWSLNWGAYRSTEWSLAFAFYGLIQTEGDLTELERQTIRAFQAHYYGFAAQLENWHTFKNNAPTIEQTIGGIVVNTNNNFNYLADIPAANRSASSVYGAGLEADKGFLGNTNVGSTAWASATTTDATDWYQMDVGAVKNIVGVAVQARSNDAQYVMTYRVDVSIDGIIFNRLAATYNGPTAWADTNNGWAIVAELPAGTVARYVRIVPVTFTGHKSLRADLIVRD